MFMSIIIPINTEALNYDGERKPETTCPGCSSLMSKDMIDKYLKQGICMCWRTMASGCALPDEGEGVWEIKNIARPRRRGKGMANMIDYLARAYGERHLIGTHRDSQRRSLL